MRFFRLTLVAMTLVPAIAAGALHVLVVEGLPGEEVYASQFDQQVVAIRSAVRSVTDDDRIIVLRTADASREAILERISALKGRLSSDDNVAIFLIGHGSYDDYEYKFNIGGPDLTGEDLAAALEDTEAANVVVINTSSASGATTELLAGENRILVLATRSGAERHATRFGPYFVSALTDPAADTNKNDLVTVREAFDFAERRVSDYFERNDQLATEHPILDGERADRLTLARLGEARPVVVDTALAELLAERDALTAEIDTLRLARDDMDAADYQSGLLQKMLELARIEEAIEQREQEIGTND